MEKYVSVHEIEKVALEILPKSVKDYYKSGATDEITLEENKRAYQRLRIQAKCLVGVEKFNISTTVLGWQVTMPIGIAPTAMQRMAHPDGELANARAAQEAGILFTLSTLATSSIEEVAQAAPACLKWFQLYIYKDREITRNLIQRVEKANFKAIVLTVDAPVLGLRRSDKRNNFQMPSHLRFAHFENQQTSKMKEDLNGSGLNNYTSDCFDKSLSWNDIKWLKSITNLPIVVKGILRADDAVKAAEAGCAAVAVSNHGARQLDGVPATIEVLPEIVNAVKPYNLEVYLDGGVRNGTDVYKALALGARMVFIGRAALWGLAVGGQAGVEKVLEILRTELEYAVQISGTPTINDITRDMVRHVSSYSKL